MNGSYEMTAKQQRTREAEVRSVYEELLVRIVVSPSWAKVIDFEETVSTPSRS